MKYAFRLVELMVYPLSVVCRVLNVTQTGLHAWRIREPSTRERDLLRADIRKVFDAHRGRYGAPRLYRVLRARHGYTGMESFWHSLKVEETHGQDFATHAEAKHCVGGYIEGWYHTTRMHSSLGYQSPNQFERKCNAKGADAANDDLSTVSSNDRQSARLNKRAA